MDELLKPQPPGTSSGSGSARGGGADPQGMAQTRLKAATLLCKIFLQYVVRLVESESEAVGGLFVRVLDKLERFMRTEREILVSPLNDPTQPFSPCHGGSVSLVFPHLRSLTVLSVDLNMR